MIDEFINTTVLNYLERHFPIKRLKDETDNRFKRGIVLGIQKFFFRPKANISKLYTALYNDIYLAFGLSNEEIKPILSNYLNSNKYYDPEIGF